MSQDQTKDILKFRIGGITTRRMSREIETVIPSGSDEGLIINARSLFGAMIAYMDWLDILGFENVNVKELMWSQINIELRSNYDGIEDYVNEYLFDGPITQYLIEITNDNPVISFPQTLVKSAAKK